MLFRREEYESAILHGDYENFDALRAGDLASDLLAESGLRGAALKEATNRLAALPLYSKGDRS